MLPLHQFAAYPFGSLVRQTALFALSWGKGRKSKDDKKAFLARFRVHLSGPFYHKIAEKGDNFGHNVGYKLV